MENQTNIQISIPKPCHEDWNKMTPNEKGSFCNKCAKTVIDFTQKTNEEIRNFLTERSGKKICGRFLNEQLNQPLEDVDFFIPIHLIPKRLSINKIFALSLFIAFGTTLFSCSTTKGEVIGKIYPEINPLDTISQSSEQSLLIGDTILIENTINKKNNQIKCPEIKDDIDMKKIKGEVAIPADTNSSKGKVKKEFIRQGNKK